MTLAVLIFLSRSHDMPSANASETYIIFACRDRSSRCLQKLPPAPWCISLSF
jgi:hypothetical protein